MHGEGEELDSIIFMLQRNIIEKICNRLILHAVDLVYKDLGHDLSFLLSLSLATGFSVWKLPHLITKDMNSFLCCNNSSNSC